jgi:hypothetical protein
MLARIRSEEVYIYLWVFSTSSTVGERLAGNKEKTVRIIT